MKIQEIFQGMFKLISIIAQLFYLRRHWAVGQFNLELTSDSL